jgi:hypothetical protein
VNLGLDDGVLLEASDGRFDVFGRWVWVRHDENACP